MPVLEVVPRPTPAERYDAAVEVDVEEALTVHAATIEDWVAPRQQWEMTLREGTDFGRPNNVEGVLLFASGEQTSSISFRQSLVKANPNKAFVCSTVAMIFSTSFSSKGHCNVANAFFRPLRSSVTLTTFKATHNPLSDVS